MCVCVWCREMVQSWCVSCSELQKSTRRPLCSSTRLTPSALKGISPAWLVNTVRPSTPEKRSQFSFVFIFFVLDRNWWIFFTHIRPKESRSISCNSVYLVLAHFENFATTLIWNTHQPFNGRGSGTTRVGQWYETFYVYQSSNQTDEYRLVFIVSISL